MTMTHSPRRTAALGALLVAVSAGTWWAWLGWDHEYYTDPATGQAAGPYRPWQVIGCILTLLAVAAIAHALMHTVAVGVAMTVGFAAGFASSSVPGDETGLALVGVFLVVIGMSFASVVLALVAVGVRLAVGRAH
ncbi:hypothetical protein [uncultured Phycicoccus sp.]|uniref:hypothetical protein n=1 Tax=uncultured Phycicoccus sp. TaxID=661422 RepID=UPI0026225D1E|nr:hypothetical protein [uncultured Phycicoccus sp.]